MFKWFIKHGGSQTVVWAKVQQIIGVVGSVVMYSLYAVDGLNPYDIAPFVPPKLVPALPMVLFAVGKVTQILRERPGSSDPVVYSRKAQE
jgi:hypothetical protein